MSFMKILFLIGFFVSNLLANPRPDWEKVTSSEIYKVFAGTIVVTDKVSVFRTSATFTPKIVLDGKFGLVSASSFTGSGVGLTGVIDSAVRISTGIINMDLQTSKTAIGTSTATLRTDLSSEISRAIARENSIGVSTGIINADLQMTKTKVESIAVSTGLINADLQTTKMRVDSIAVSTGLINADLQTTKTRIDSIAISTGIINADLQSSKTAIGISTTSLRTDLTAVRVSTGLINTDLQDSKIRIAASTTTLRNDLITETNARISGDYLLSLDIVNLDNKINAETSERIFQDGLIGEATGHLRGDLNAVTSDVETLKTNLLSVGVATGTLRTDLNAVMIATGTLRTDLTAVGIATGTLRSDLISVGVATGTLRADLTAIGISTGIINSDLQASKNAIGISTKTLRTDLTALSVSTGTLVRKSGDIMTGNLIIGASIQANVFQCADGTFFTSTSTLGGVVTGIGDNLGNHIATTTLQMGSFGINISSDITGVKAVRWSDGTISTTAAGGATGWSGIATSNLNMNRYSILNSSGITNFDYILSTGALGTGWTEPGLGAGVRFLWYPRKAALRAGEIYLDRWNDSKIGLYSVALGYGGLASGVNSVALLGGVASGDWSLSLGGISSGYASFTLGTNISATATNSMVIGTGLHAGARLINNIPDSLMIGYNQTTPTFTVQKDTVTVVGLVSATKFSGDGSGLTNLPVVADNLGNHIATTTLNMAGNRIINVSTITFTDGKSMISVPRVVTRFVAASNAPIAQKLMADYVCDGTDDHHEINQAITDVHNLGGGTVLLSEGTFYMLIDGREYEYINLDKKQNITIRGFDKFRTILLVREGHYFFPVIGLFTSGNVHVWTRNIKIENFTISAWANVIIGYGTWDWSTNADFENITIDNIITRRFPEQSYASPFNLFVARGKNITITNCEFLDFGVSGDVGSISLGGEGIYFANNRITLNPDAETIYAIYLFSAKNAVISGNILDMRNITSDKTHLTGVHISIAENITFSDNVLLYNNVGGTQYNGIYLQANCKNIKIVNNTVVGNKYEAIKIGNVQENLTAYRHDGILISGNQIVDCGYGISWFSISPQIYDIMITNNQTRNVAVPLAIDKTRLLGTYQIYMNSWETTLDFDRGISVKSVIFDPTTYKVGVSVPPQKNIFTIDDKQNIWISTGTLNAFDWKQPYNDIKDNTGTSRDNWEIWASSAPVSLPPNSTTTISVGGRVINPVISQIGKNSTLVYINAILTDSFTVRNDHSTETTNIHWKAIVER